MLNASKQCMELPPANLPLLARATARRIAVRLTVVRSTARCLTRPVDERMRSFVRAYVCTLMAGHTSHMSVIRTAGPIDGLVTPAGGVGMGWVYNHSALASSILEYALMKRTHSPVDLF